MGWGFLNYEGSSYTGSLILPFEAPDSVVWVSILIYTFNAQAQPRLERLYGSTFLLQLILGSTVFSNAGRLDLK